MSHGSSVGVEAPCPDPPLDHQTQPHPQPQASTILTTRKDPPLPAPYQSSPPFPTPYHPILSPSQPAPNRLNPISSHPTRHLPFPPPPTCYTSPTQPLPNSTPPDPTPTRSYLWHPMPPRPPQPHSRPAPPYAVSPAYQAPPHPTPSHLHKKHRPALRRLTCISSTGPRAMASKRLWLGSCPDPPSRSRQKRCAPQCGCSCAASAKRTDSFQ